LLPRRDPHFSRTGYPHPAVDNLPAPFPLPFPDRRLPFCLCIPPVPLFFPEVSNRFSTAGIRFPTNAYSFIYSSSAHNYTCIFTNTCFGRMLSDSARRDCPSPEGSVFHIPLSKTYRSRKRRTNPVFFRDSAPFSTVFHRFQVIKWVLISSVENPFTGLSTGSFQQFFVENSLFFHARMGENAETSCRNIRFRSVSHNHKHSRFLPQNIRSRISQRRLFHTLFLKTRSLRCQDGQKSSPVRLLPAGSGKRKIHTALFNSTVWKTFRSDSIHPCRILPNQGSRHRIPGFRSIRPATISDRCRRTTASAAESGKNLPVWQQKKNGSGAYQPTQPAVL